MPVPSSLPSCGHLSIFHYNVHSNWGILVVVVVVVIVVIIVCLIVVLGGVGEATMLVDVNSAQHIERMVPMVFDSDD
jgi:hypothetical protein